MPKNDNKVAIILPTYNEAENIQSLISAILAQEKKTNFAFEIIVSDSASPDGTGKKVLQLALKNPKIHLLDVKVRGIGLAIVRACELAISTLAAKYLVIMDADFSHNPEDLPRLLSAAKNYDLVIGSRLVKGGKNLLPFYRRILSWGESLLMRFLTGFFEVREWGTAFRVIKVSLWKKINIEKLPWKKKSFIFQPAFLYFALAAGAKWCEVPIVFADRKRGKSKIAFFSYTVDTLKFAFEIFLRRRATFVKFLIVGTIGFIVNTLALLISYDTKIFPLPDKLTPWHILNFTHPDSRLFIASVLAVETAIISNFLWHENWTFRWRPKRGPIVARFARFNVIAILSPIIQVATVNILTPFFGIYYLISNAIGVLLGLIWNWLWNSRVIWRG